MGVGESREKGTLLRGAGRKKIVLHELGATSLSVEGLGAFLEFCGEKRHLVGEKSVRTLGCGKSSWAEGRGLGGGKRACEGSVDLEVWMCAVKRGEERRRQKALMGVLFK